MKKVFATLAALAAFVSVAFAQNPETVQPAATDSTLVAVPAPQDTCCVATDSTTVHPIADYKVECPELADSTVAHKCNGICHDKLLANHLSLGLTLGLDGIGAQLALPLGKHFSVRAGYSYLGSLTKSPRDLSDGMFSSLIPDEEDLKFDLSGDDGRQVNLYDVPITLNLNTFGPNVMVDYFPWKNAGFHLTAGAFFTKGTLLAVDADVHEQLREDEYASLGISFKDVEDITTDEKGVMHFDMRASGFRPYIGIGFGRPLNMKHRVSVNFDMGVVVLGSSGIYSYNYAGRSGVEDVQITSAKLDNEDDGILDKIGKFPVFPMMKLSVNVRLF